MDRNALMRPTAGWRRDDLPESAFVEDRRADPPYKYRPTESFWDYLLRTSRERNAHIDRMWAWNSLPETEQNRLMQNRLDDLSGSYMQNFNTLSGPP